MSECIFVVVEGQMSVLRRASSDDDVLLASLVERHLEVIAAAAGTDEQHRLLLVRRLTGVGASDSQTGLVYVDSEAIPVVVVVQPNANAMSGAEAVGMLLDCVASGVLQWQGGGMREVFQLTHVGTNDADLLAHALGWDGDPDAFWAKVEVNVADHRVRLVLVTGRLTEEVLRVIDFLNDQLRVVELFGVEVACYGSGPAQAFVPGAQRHASNGRFSNGVTGIGGRHRLPN